jgi:hypothetical protein
MTWLWITLGCLCIAMFLWGICAGSNRNRENDDVYQIAAIEAWETKQAEKAKRKV